MKKLMLVLMCAATMTSVAGCGAKEPVTPEVTKAVTETKTAEEQETVGETVGMPNPWIDCKSLQDAEDNTGFSITVPDNIDGYTQTMIQTLDKEVIQAFYEKNDNSDETILIRKGIGSDDIIGSIAYMFAAILSIKAIKAEKTPADTLQNTSAIENVLDTYGNAILRLAYSYIHNMSDAEDILQDTLIKYMQSSPAFLTEGHKKAWLLHVAANLSKNKINYNKIRETDELEETLVAEEREDLSFVWEAVKALPEKYREVLHLYYQEGYPTKEISKILNRNENSVRSDLKRGREALKQVLKEAYDFE